MGKARVILMPLPAVGHLISMVEFSKLLLKDPHTPFTITILLIRVDIPSWASAIQDYIDHTQSLNLDITFAYLPSVDPPSAERPETFATLLADAHKHHVKEAMFNFKHSSATSNVPILALVLDMFCTSVIDVGKEFGICTYIYFPSTAAMLTLMLHFTEHYLTRKSGVAEKCIELPGLSLTLPMSCVPNVMRGDEEDEACKIFLRHGERFKEVEGIIVNTFEELEPGPVKALMDGSYPEIFAVGPLLAVETKKKKEGSARHECLKWLDDQPGSSVVFLCFGSCGCLEGSQVDAVAQGLEQSKHRFLWILRSPSNHMYRLPTDSKLDEVLPSEFIQRTKDRGMVWPSWAPQVEILSHPSIGGFLTHCGWNSSLESIWHGVPMLAWPLYADQHLNAFEMGKVLGICVELEFDDVGFVSAEDVERGVRVLMGEEGAKVRKRIGDLKVTSRRSLEVGGSGWFALQRFVKKVVGDIAIS